MRMRTISTALPRYTVSRGLSGDPDAGYGGRDSGGSDGDGGNENDSDSGDRSSGRDPAADASRDATSRAQAEAARAGLDRDTAAAIGDRAATAAADAARRTGSKGEGDRAGMESIARDVETARNAMANVKPSTLYQKLAMVVKTPVTMAVATVAPAALAPAVVPGVGYGTKKLSEVMDEQRTAQKRMEAAQEALGVEAYHEPRDASESYHDHNGGDSLRETSMVSRMTSSVPSAAIVGQSPLAQMQVMASGGTPWSNVYQAETATPEPETPWLVIGAILGIGFLLNAR